MLPATPEKKNPILSFQGPLWFEGEGGVQHAHSSKQAPLPWLDAGLGFGGIVVPFRVLGIRPKSADCAASERSAWRTVSGQMEAD